MTLVEKIAAAVDDKHFRVTQWPEFDKAQAVEWMRHVEHARKVLARHTNVQRNEYTLCRQCGYQMVCPEIRDLAEGWGIPDA